MARYASLCQQHGLVPIVEPDMLLDGNHTLERAQEVSEEVLAAVFKALNDHHVYLEGIVLKTSMVTPGSQSKKRTPEDIAKATVETLKRTVPSSVPGVGFLSGGLTEEDATAYLNAINKFNGLKPWRLTFCFGRALVGTTLNTWAGKGSNVKAAQQVFLNRTKANALASQPR